MSSQDLDQRAWASHLDIKLIEPSDPGSPLVEFVRRGGGLHHLAFRVDDVAQASSDLVDAGARILVQPQPGEAFDDHDIAFVFLGTGLNAELIDTHARRARVSECPAPGARSIDLSPRPIPESNGGLQSDSDTCLSGGSLGDVGVDTCAAGSPRTRRESP